MKFRNLMHQVVTICIKVLKRTKPMYCLLFFQGDRTAPGLGKKLSKISGKKK